MAQSAADSRPEWISDSLYPFQSRFFAAPGGRMHYLDEGSGAPIVFVHGNPSWSFEFRHLVARLRDRFRCVAPDHLGFGLSARSERPEDHHPASHAGNFAALMDHLNRHAGRVRGPEPAHARSHGALPARPADPGGPPGERGIAAAHRGSVRLAQHDLE